MPGGILVVDGHAPSGSLLWGHMQLRLLVPVFLQLSLLLVLCIALNSCQSHKANSAPSIELTHIPPALLVHALPDGLLEFGSGSWLTSQKSTRSDAVAPIAKREASRLSGLLGK